MSMRIVIVAALGVAMCQGCSKPASGASSGAPAGSGAAERAIPVTTAKVERRDVPTFASGLGTVTPLATVTVKSQVDGRLDRVLFKEGDAVKRGDVLAQIDPRPFQIQLEQGQASLTRDEATLKNSQLDLDRYEKLRQGNLIPQQQLDQQRVTVATSSASTKADQSQIASARLMLEYARIVSPIDGVTGVRLVDPGNIIHPTDATGIVIVTQMDPIGVLFTLPQDDLPRVQAAMQQGKPRVEALARDEIQKLGEGDLLLIDNEVNPATATIRLKAVLPNPTRALWPNQFVKARLHLETKKDALVVPAAAITRGPQGAFVYVVGKDGTAQSKTVQIASIEGDLAILVKGVEPGDTVVTDGQNQLRAGSKVAPRPASSASSSSAPPPAPPHS
jgi:multidrug efflux system membrane fusion protein